MLFRLKVNDILLIVHFMKNNRKGKFMQLQRAGLNKVRRKYNMGFSR